MAPLHFRKTSLASDDRNQGYDCIQLVGIRFNLLGISMMRNAFKTENRPQRALQNPGTQENASPPVVNSVSLLSHKGLGYPMGFKSQNAFVEYSAATGARPFRVLYSHTGNANGLFPDIAFRPYYVSLNLINTQSLSVKLSSAGYSPTAHQ